MFLEAELLGLNAENKTALVEVKLISKTGESISKRVRILFDQSLVVIKVTSKTAPPVIRLGQCYIECRITREYYNQTADITFLALRDGKKVPVALRVYRTRLLKKDPELILLTRQNDDKVMRRR